MIINNWLSILNRKTIPNVNFVFSNTIWVKDILYKEPCHYSYIFKIESPLNVCNISLDDDSSEYKYFTANILEFFNKSINR